MVHAVELLTLENDDLRLVLAPETGGSVQALEYRRRGEPVDVMRPGRREALEQRDPLELAMFPLSPYSNRIRNSRLTFHDRHYEIEPNVPGYPHALHGPAWKAAWEVTAREADRLEIAYDHDRSSKAGWPWPHRTVQRFELKAATLAVEIEVTNRSDETMPAGLGLHPYFHKSDDVTLQAEVQGVWRSDQDALPIEKVALPEQWRFADTRRLAELELDHCFTGWDGRARIEWPSRELSLTMRHRGPMRHLVVFVPPGKNFFCVEPVTHMNDGFNMAEQGVSETGRQELAPGETLRCRVDFDVEG